jgi:hypothetical protein
MTPFDVPSPTTERRVERGDGGGEDGVAGPASALGDERPGLAGEAIPSAEVGAGGPVFDAAPRKGHPHLAAAEVSEASTIPVRRAMPTDRGTREKDVHTPMNGSACSASRMRRRSAPPSVPSGTLLSTASGMANPSARKCADWRTARDIGVLGFFASDWLRR